MTILRLLMISALSCAASAAQPGRAAVEWIASSATVQPGKPLRTAIRMKHDDGWHSYWINPGEAGMPTTVEWKLPPGWKCGGLAWPAPIRFLSGGLAGFGYEGTVLYPVMLTAPEDFNGEARLTAVVSWLACSEEGCVPGKEEVHLTLRAGEPAATQYAAAIRQAHEQVPQAREGMRLGVTENESRLALSIRHDSGSDADLTGCQVFPATADLIDPVADIHFTRTGGSWTAEAALGAFAARPVKQLTLVLAGGALPKPLQMTWTAP